MTSKTSMSHANCVVVLRLCLLRSTQTQISWNTFYDSTSTWNSLGKKIKPCWRWWL